MTILSRQFRRVIDVTHQSHNLRTGLLLLAVVFLAHFLLWNQFGLYEDDYFYTLSNFNMGFQDWISKAWDALVNPIQSRPINHFFRRTFFALTLQGNSLQLAYGFSCLLITINAGLVYRVASHASAPLAGAVAALVYILYPADNSRQIIMHQSDIHLGVLFAMLSLFFFQSRRPIWAWIFAAACLGNYESFFLPLLFAPLLCQNVGLKDRRPLLRHAVIWTALICIVSISRYFLGDERVSHASANKVEIAARILHSYYVGPATALHLSLIRPIEAIFHLTATHAVVALLVAVLTTLLIREKILHDAPISLKYSFLFPTPSVIGGLGALAFSYSFAFRPDYYPAVPGIGRLTALHVPGSLAMALTLGALAGWIHAKLQNKLKDAWIIFIALWAGLAAAFGFEIQRGEYADHWQKQRQFWLEIFAQIPDLQENDVLLVDAEGPAASLPITSGFPRFGSVNYPPLALPYFLEIPDGWRKTPRVFGLWADAKLEKVGDGVRICTPPWMTESTQPVVYADNLIFFRVINGHLIRQHGLIEIKGHTFNLRPQLASDSPAWKTTAIFRSLIENRPDATPWPSITSARNYP